MASSLTVEPITYRAEIDFAPAYELTLSLSAYANRPDHRLLELGPAWIKGVEERLSPELAAELDDIEKLEALDLVTLLVRCCPAPRDAESFIRWFSGLSAGELYDRLASHSLDSPPRDLIAFRDRYTGLLAAWNDQYFRTVDPAIIAALEADALEKGRLSATMTPVELVEYATNGLLFVPREEIELVLLVPQYHHRPWNVFTFYRGMRLYRYPADVAPLAPGEPPPALLRVARTLADESRLRILKHLAEEPLTFTDLVRLTGLAKSTVHHHMVALRAAGLVRVHDSGDKAVTYSLRPDAEERLASVLGAYLRST